MAMRLLAAVGILMVVLFLGCGKQTEQKTAWSLLGGTADEMFSAVAVDSSGNVYAVGTTNSYGFGSNDILLAKFDAKLKLQWAKAVGDSNTQTPVGIAVTSDAIYVCGIEQTHGFLAKFDKDGNLQWAKSWSDGNVNTLKSMVVSGSYVYVVGSTSANSMDAVVVKFGTDGSHYWSQQWGGGGSDSLNTLLYAGGVLWCVGYTASTTTYDVAVIKVTSLTASPTLDGQWAFNGGGDDRAFAAFLSGSALTVAGWSDSFGSGYRDVFLAELNISLATPAITWAKFCDVGANCGVTGLSTTPSGLYAICGSRDNKPLYLEAKANAQIYPYAYGGQNVTQGAFTDAASGAGHLYLAGWAENCENLWSSLTGTVDNANFSSSSINLSWTAVNPSIADIATWSSVDVSPSGSGGTEGFVVRPY